MEQKFDEIIKTLGRAQNVLVVTHVFPDGDALGSLLAMGDILESLGKNVVLYSEEKVSHLYDFLPGSNKLVTTLPDLSVFDCALALDCGDKYRLGKEMDRLLEVHPFIMIDHHAGNKKFGDISWVDPKRASTAEMVFDLSVALDTDLSYDAAYCLYAAIVSDTGSFKYSSTTAETFRVARELIVKGVKPSEVAGKLFDNFTVSRLSLMNEVLASLQLYENNQIALITVTQEMFDKTGASPGDTETFINYPRSLGTVKVAAFVKENKGDEISVSLRSKGKDCDVAQVAEKFGGGGHRNAAGFRVPKEDINEVRNRLLKEVRAMINANSV